MNKVVCRLLLEHRTFGVDKGITGFNPGRAVSKDADNLTNNINDERNGTLFGVIIGDAMPLWMSSK